jgi:hypothetical protein
MFDSFWPPRIGDIWLSGLDQEHPTTFVCTQSGWLAGPQAVLMDDAVSKRHGPLRLIWRDGNAVTASHVDELNPVNVEVTGPEGVRDYAGIRRIHADALDVWPDEANLEPGVLRVGPRTEIRFLTDQQISEIAYVANEHEADQKER